MSPKLKLGIALLVLGSIGVLSMLTVSIPLDSLPKAATEKFSAEELKWLMLINPMFLTIIAILIGTALHDKVNLRVPGLEYLLNGIDDHFSFLSQLKSGIIFGVISGLIITLISYFFQSFLPAEYFALGSKINITVTARLLYGGITEELLMRFGFMTFIVWIVFKISKRLNHLTYYIGILLSSLIFGLGHLPIVFSTVAHPSVFLIAYIIIGNSAAGILFGWQFWKKGLEAAMMAHIFAHITMIAAEQIFHIK
jgi:hypothetical protein